MTDRLAVEANGTRLDEQRFPGRQGRILFAYLAAQKGRPVPRDELAELLWDEELPATWEKAIRVLMTKLRALLTECGIDGASALTSAFGCYQLTLPEGAWIDVHAAANALERAETALAAGDHDYARAQASTAAELARRVFLPGEDGPWVEDQRRNLRDILVRGLECLRDAALANGDYVDAVRYAAEITDLEPFRESSYRALMQAHATAGDPAEALRVYERCRRFLADELGAYPSPESEAVYRELLRSSPGRSVPEAEQLGAEGAGPEPPPSPTTKGTSRSRGKMAALVAGGLLVAAVVALAADEQGAGDDGRDLAATASGRLVVLRRRPRAASVRCEAPDLGVRATGRAAEDLEIDGLGLRRRVGAELVGEEAPAALVHAECLGRVAGGDVRLHQRAVAGLAEGLESGDLGRISDCVPELPLGKRRIA